MQIAVWRPDQTEPDQTEVDQTEVDQTASESFLGMDFHRELCYNGRQKHPLLNEEGSPG